MGVPNTTNFSFQDVCDVVYGDHGAGRNLVAAFAEAIDGYFDPTYKGSKDRLSNFRNYGALYFSVDQDLFNLNNTAQTIYIHITSNMVGMTYDTSEPTWLHVSGDTPDGNATLTVTVDQNLSGFDRVGFISITYTGGTKDCRINQSA